MHPRQDVDRTGFASSGLSRRELGALTAGGLASLALPRRGRTATPPPAPLALAPGDAVPVALTGLPRGTRPEDVARAVRTTALAVDDLAWLHRGDTVLIKVACNSGNAYPATTDPVAIRAMVELFRERGAGRVIVADMSGVQAVRFSKDRTRGSTRALMEQNGIARAARDAGADVQAFEEAGWDGFYDERPNVQGTWAGPVMLPAVLREVDHIVLMPRCSRHLLAGSTLGLKAAVGWWRHDTRLEYHRDAATFSEKTADANFVPTMLARQRLVVTCATQLLTSFGPDTGYVHTPETGLVFASRSLVAHDMVSLAWLLEGRREMPAEKRSGLIDDPNGSGTFVNVANRVVVGWLGGMGSVLRTEWLERYDLERVWDDRVLRRAFAVQGGVPRLELGGDVPPALRDRIAAHVTLPA